MTYFIDYEGTRDMKIDMFFTQLQILSSFSGLYVLPHSLLINTFKFEPDTFKSENFNSYSLLLLL